MLADNPLLTCRIPEGTDPIRIVCDTNCRIPLDSNILQTAHDVPTYIVCHTYTEEKRQAIELMGANLLAVPLRDNHLDLHYLLHKLGELGIDSVLVEGGGTLNESLLKTGLVNALKIYLAPKIIGDTNSKTPVEGLGVDTPDEAYHFTLMSTTRIGNDILLEYNSN